MKEGNNAKAPRGKDAREGLIKFRPWQGPVFRNIDYGIIVLHWSRQIGKSYVLAAWAINRLLEKLKSHQSWLVTVLSNSRENGAEFVFKCCNDIAAALGVPGEASDESPDDVKFENMKMAFRVKVGNRIGRILVLAANPRTARGFSGDLILDEFAFHENSAAIWEAAEPIISANPEFQCRIASTGNGKHNMFYRMVSGTGTNAKAQGGKGAEAFFESASGFMVSRVTRSAAYQMGLKIYDPVSRKAISPEEARSKALDKRAYDQNYECAFADENMVLLTYELIQMAERSGIGIDEQQWSEGSIARMFRAQGELFVGNDIGRNRDLSVVTVLEKAGRLLRVVGLLRMSGLRLPAQQAQVDPICRLPKFAGYEGDMTGLGLGLVEYLQDKFGMGRIRGVNFSSSEPITDAMKLEGRKQETARVTEVMATDLLGVFEDRRIEIPVDNELREDLRKPEKITSPGGRVSIAATRDEAGHADHFWSLALAVRAALAGGTGIGAEELAKIRVGTGHGSRLIFKPRQLGNRSAGTVQVLSGV